MVPQEQLKSTLVLESQGLLAALEQLKKDVAEIAKPALIPIHLEADKDVEKLLSKEAQDVIFHIAAEAIANACKHAQADNLYLRLYQHDMDVITAVEDDGVGFDIAKVEANYATARLKLEERAASVNGRIEIESAPGKGTKVTMTIPVDVKPTAVGD